MNTYFVFWEKHETNSKFSNLEGRSLQASEVSACNGELNFWLEVGSMAKENLVFSVPLANLVDFHIVKPLEIITQKEGEPPKIDCEFVEWIKEDAPLKETSIYLQKHEKARRKIHPTIASFVKSVFPDKLRKNSDEPLTEGEKARALSIQSQLREARPDGERMVWP